MSTSNSSTASSSQPFPGITNFTRITYSILSIVAMIGNTLVIFVFVENKELLRKSYNILILSLAISDVMTALLLISNPAFVLGNAFPYPTNHVIGDIFCRFIWSRVILFQLVVFSAYICMALATERWYAVVRPLRYNQAFSKKRTLVYIFLVWLWSLLLLSTTPFEIAYVPSNPPNRRCKWKFLWSQNTARVVVGIIQILFKMVLPSMSMSCLFIHMVYKASRSKVASAESKAKLRGKITRMVGAACFMLIICFAPSQTNYALAIIGKVRMDTKLHHILSLLVFVSSCVNPFIYGISNKNYRRGYLKILFSVCPKAIAKKRFQNGIEDERGASRQTFESRL
ncbi:melatonin receptor type 1A-like [Stylophora pistillata]|nr:melatonin receptor type 1A-like [Stylophora pistillata]